MILGWHTPTAIQLDEVYLILNANLVLPPFSRLGSMMANLYPELFVDLTSVSDSTLTSGCFNVVENIYFITFHNSILLIVPPNSQHIYLT